MGRDAVDLAELMEHLNLSLHLIRVADGPHTPVRAVRVSRGGRNIGEGL